MGPSNLELRQRVVRALPYAVLATCVFALALGRLWIATATHSVPMLSPETGAALGGLLLGGRRLWPAIAAGMLAALLLAAPDLPFLAKVALALIEAGGAYAAATAVARFASPPSRGFTLRHMRPLVAGAALAIGIGAAGTALVAVLTDTQALPRETFLAAFAERATGMLVTLPLVLAWATVDREAWPVRRLLHLAALLLVGGAVSALIAFGTDTDRISWAMFPILLWATLAFELRGATLMMFLLSALVTAGTAFGMGPFETQPFLPPIPSGQICVSAVTITLLVLAARSDLRGQMREARARLHERDAQLKLFIDHVPAAVAIFDREMNFVAASRRFATDHGLPQDASLIGQSYRQFFPNAGDSMPALHLRVLDGEEFSGDEDPYVRPDGRIDYYRWNLRPWRGLDGQVAGGILFSEAVTDAVEARRRVQMADARFRAVFEQAVVGVARLSLDGKILDVNDRLCEITQCPREELIACGFAKFTHPDDLDGEMQAGHEMVAGRRRSYEAEKRIMREDGSVAWAQMTVGLVRDAEGEPDCLVVVMEDVTDRKRAEADLAQSEARLRLAQEAAGVGVWEIDLDRGLVTHSPASLRMHGLPDTGGIFTVEELATYYSPELGDEVRQKVNNAALLGLPYDITYPVQVSGGERWIHSMGRHEPGDGPLGIVRGASIDVTEFQRAQGNLVEAHERLLRVSRLSAMGAMASTLAHELNQPLAAISNYSFACLAMLTDRANPEDATLLDMLDSIKGQALRAGEVIRRMRQFTITGEISPEPEDLGHLVARAWASERDRRHAAKVRFETRFAPGLNRVLVDRTQIEQVLANLMRNALEAMNGEVERNLTIEAWNRGEMVSIRVADNGPGLSAQALDNLFQPFVSSKRTGMGLGLPICRTIIEAHGGRIRAESIEGCGCVFTIELPAAACEVLDLAS